MLLGKEISKKTRIIIVILTICISIITIINITIWIVNNQNDIKRKEELKSVQNAYHIVLEYKNDISSKINAITDKLNVDEYTNENEKKKDISDYIVLSKEKVETKIYIYIENEKAIMYAMKILNDTKLLQESISTEIFENKEIIDFLSSYRELNYQAIDIQVYFFTGNVKNREIEVKKHRKLRDKIDDINSVLESNSKDKIEKSIQLIEAK